MSKDHDRLVDDDSLGDPRFINAAWDVMRQNLISGNAENVERVAEELARSMEAGYDILRGNEDAADTGDIGWGRRN